MKKFYSTILAALAIMFTSLVASADDTATPGITISFDEDSYTLGVASRYYASITATPTIVAEGFDSYNVYYNLYMGATRYRNAVQVQPTDGRYVITIDDLNFSRAYKLEVYATAGDYTSDIATLEFTSPGEPSVNIIKAVAEETGETSVKLVVEYAPVSLIGDLTYIVSISSTTPGAVAVDPVTTTETAVIFDINGLTPGTIYTYNLKIQTTDAAGSTYQTDRPVVFETLKASRVINLSDISYVRIEKGAIFTVGTVETIGFDDDAVIDIYFSLKGSDAAPAKATLVTDGDTPHYEYTFENLNPFSPYTAIIYGGVGEYGTDSFFKGAEYKQNFVSGELSGVDSVITNSSTARYFNLQGIEVQNPTNGTYIKLDGNNVSKVVLK